MTDVSAHIAAIQRFGYTERQAAFLYKVAVHSGYFLGRQYETHIEQPHGGNSQRFLNHLLQNRHAKPVYTSNKTTLFHLSAKPFYTAIDDDNNRNRRPRPTFQIRAKIMMLDFILTRPDDRFLTSEQKRVQFFTEECGVPLTALPAKHYVSKHSKSVTTTRYFVDKNPIFISSGTPRAAPVVGFAYVDGGSASTAGFRTYLHQYRRLFDALPSFHVVYVGVQEKLFPAARRDFEKVVERPHGDMPDVERLLAHFERRLAFELKDYSGFTTESIKQYFREKKEFSGVRYDALFEVFQMEGKAAVLVRFSEHVGQEQRARRGSFEVHPMPDRYGCIGATCTV